MMVPAGRAGWVVLLRCVGGLARIMVGCPLTPVVSLGLRARGLVWRRGPTVKGHALLLRARRSEFRFPTEAPGHPAIWSAAGDGGEPW